jgi:hypothetical protein
MGGLTKEWFQLLIRKIFDPDYGMFVYFPHSRCYWFSVSKQGNLREYNLIGMEFKNSPALVLKAVVLKAVVLKAVVLKAVVLKAVVLKAVVLKAVVLKAVVLKAVVLKAEVLKAVVLKAVVLKVFS